MKYEWKGVFTKDNTFIFIEEAALFLPSVATESSLQSHASHVYRKNYHDYDLVYTREKDSTLQHGVCYPVQWNPANKNLAN